MRKVVRVMLWIIAIQTVAYLAGQIISKRLSRGDSNSDDFKLAALFGGKKFSSRANDLHSGSVMTAMGGVDIDLRQATLARGGAYLDLTATMGGIRVLVPEGWAVDVDAEARAGGCETRVTPSDELPADAPRLNVHAVARMGGVLVTTQE